MYAVNDKQGYLYFLEDLYFTVYYFKYASAD